MCPSLGCPTGSFLLPQCPQHAWKEVQVLLLPAGGDPDRVPGADDLPHRGAPGPALPHQKHQWQVGLSQPLRALCSRGCPGQDLNQRGTGGGLRSRLSCHHHLCTWSLHPATAAALWPWMHSPRDGIPSFHPPFPLCAC